MTIFPRTVGISAYDYPAAELLMLARAADDFGFEALWCGEHYVIPGRHESVHPTNATKREDAEENTLATDVRLYDPWFLLGAVAGATRRLKIGTAICIAPLNNPLLLARASITAHEVSNGRFRFGVGAGWLREEFDALAIPFEQRGRRLDETIEILRKAWAGGFFDHQGAHFRFDSLQVTAQPADIPLVCGGNTGPALRRIGRVADAWMNSAFITLEEALRMRETIEIERRAASREARPLIYFIRPVKPDAEVVSTFVEEGFENIILWGPDVWSPEPGNIAEKIERLRYVALTYGIRPCAE